MPSKTLKKKLVSYIESAEDEELLSFFKEDSGSYGKEKSKDVTDELNEEQFRELQQLAREGTSKGVQTLAQFKKATARWRIK